MSLAELYNKANIFLVLIEYKLNSLLGASHLVDYISVHIRFDLERYLLISVRRPSFMRDCFIGFLYKKKKLPHKIVIILKKLLVPGKACQFQY